MLKVAAANLATGGKPEAQIIPFTDGAAVKAFMTRLTIQHNAQIAAQKAKAAKGG